MTLPSAFHEWQKTPRRSSARRSRAGRVIASVLGAGWALTAACTLIGDDYTPPLVLDRPLEPGDAGASDAGASVVGGCAPGLECCDDVSCSPEQVCRDGVCLVPDLGDAGCVGTDCPGSMPVPLAPTCDDDARNGDETGVDCGGSCALGCALGESCGGDVDCDEGLSCLPGTAQCTAPSCDDGVVNGDETVEDCGGGCPGCPNGSACNAGTDCESRVCGDDDTCSAPSCNDAQQNGAETAVDCGGNCPDECPNGAGCERNDDCQSSVCGGQGCAAGANTCCQAPSCNDDVQNGNESDVDCGNFACGDCAVGDRCVNNGQCTTNLCTNGVCTAVPTCTDDDQNGTETGVDCGGGCPTRCPDLSGCNLPADCASNNCLNGTCISCGDTVQNGTETDADCGGADLACRRCGTGESCLSNTDCVSVFCVGGFC